MPERVCALLGNGRGPKVPCGRGDRIQVTGGVGLFSIHCHDSFVLGDGDGVHEMPYSGFVHIEHNGVPTAAFFLLRG